LAPTDVQYGATNRSGVGLPKEAARVSALIKAEHLGNFAMFAAILRASSWLSSLARVP